MKKEFHGLYGDIERTNDKTLLENILENMDGNNYIEIWVNIGSGGSYYRPINEKRNYNLPLSGGDFLFQKIYEKKYILDRLNSLKH